MKKKFLFGAVLVAAAAVTIVACSKQASTESANEPAAKEKIESLAQRFTQPIGNDYSRVKEQYSSLSETDLRLFWAAVYKQTHPTENDAAKQAFFVSMLDEMNTATRNKFGVPFNKASKAQLEVLFSPAAEQRAPRATVNGKIMPPPPGSDCDFLPYPEYYYKAYLTPSGPSVACRTVDFYNDDCDGLELTYNGHYNRVVPITPLGDQAIAIFLQGDHIYNNGTKTRVLHRKSLAEAWFGAPGCTTINDNLRMGFEIYVEARN